MKKFNQKKIRVILLIILAGIIIYGIVYHIAENARKDELRKSIEQPLMF